MQTQKFQRKPFLVDCVQVTEENMAEVAEWCKGTVTSTDSAIAEKFKKKVQTWIQVETQQPMNDRQKQAFVGDWILYANHGFKIYTPNAFERTFEPVFKEGEPRPARIVADNGYEQASKPAAPKAPVTPSVPTEEIEGIQFEHTHSVATPCNKPCPVMVAKELVAQMKPAEQEHEDLSSEVTA